MWEESLGLGFIRLGGGPSFDIIKGTNLDKLRGSVVVGSEGASRLIPGYPALVSGLGQHPIRCF